MKKSRKIALCYFVTALLVLLIFYGGAYAEEARLGACELALYRCMNDPMNYASSENAFHCLLGYVFCKKYIDPL